MTGSIPLLAGIALLNRRFHSHCAHSCWLLTAYWMLRTSVSAEKLMRAAWPAPSKTSGRVWHLEPTVFVANQDCWGWGTYGSVPTAVSRAVPAATSHPKQATHRRSRSGKCSSGCC